jgi:hypothetical protein
VIASKMMLGWIPKVMMSSTIRELEAVRAQVAARIDAAGAASSWLFEKHAVAAGAPPEEQYLGMARSCDLYVLIVAEQQSDATEEEYDEAFKDNPEKVLVFFLGDGGADVATFRELLQNRHTRVKKDAAAELTESITSAVLDAVNTGKLVRPTLLKALCDRIEVGRRLISDVPLLDPHVIAGNDRARAMEVLKPGAHIALCGMGGAGKSLSAAISARSIADDQRTLPIVVQPTPTSTALLPLITAAVNAVRYDAGPETLHRWAHEERVFLIVDAIENVAGPERRQLMESIATWTRQYPRCGVVVCARRFADDELADFARVSAAPLNEEQEGQILASLGVGVSDITFPPQVADIAHWPMWFVLLIQLGPSAQTGLDLLQRLVDARLETAKMTSQTELLELRSAAGAVADGLWPTTEGDTRVAIDAIEAWAQDQATRRKFTERPADDVLARLGRAGLLEVGTTVAFPHRLLATILASEHVAANPELMVGVDQELAPFVAALVDDDKHRDQVLSLLSVHDVVTLARYVRLSRPIRRESTTATDGERLADAFKLLSKQSSLAVLSGPGWVAWRPARERSARVATEDKEYLDWANESDIPISLWPAQPFCGRTPEFLAASEVLARFRLRALSLQPLGDRWMRMPENEVERLLLSRDELTPILISRLKIRRDIQNELVEQLRLPDGYAFGAPLGEPRVRVWISRAGAAYANVEWGATTPTVEYYDVDPVYPREYSLEQLDVLLSADPAAAVYHDLVDHVQRQIGFRLDSQSWGQPELIAAWAW